MHFIASSFLSYLVTGGRTKLFSPQSVFKNNFVRPLAIQKKGKELGTFLYNKVFN